MIVVCAIDRPRSAIISTRSRKLKLKAKISAHAQDDDPAVEVATLGQLLYGLQLAHCRSQPVPGASVADWTPSFAPEPLPARRSLVQPIREPPGLSRIAPGGLSNSTNWRFCVKLSMNCGLGYTRLMSDIFLMRWQSRLFGRRRRETMTGVFQNGLIIPHIYHPPVPVRTWDIHRLGLRPGQHRVEFSVSERTGVAKKIRIASSV